MTDRLLLIGGSGQLGSEFVRALSKPEVECWAPASSELDISDAAALETAVKSYQPAIIINCAAFTNVDLAEDEVQQSMAINAHAPAVLADMCKKYDILLVHYSTDYVFSGEPEDEQTLHNGYASDAPANPLGVYGKSKWEGEVAIRNAQCRYLIVRVSWLCGYFGKNFVKTMLKLGSERERIGVVHDQLGSPSFTQPVVEQTLALIKANASGTFHIASDGVISWFDLAAEVMLHAGLPCEVHPLKTYEYPTKAKRPSFSKLNCDATVSITSQPMGNWKTHLKKVLDELINEHN
ncbi:MAG: dTDP-4-dehydrorhamnose reductase [Bacteroidetes bacterium]|nr:dTDP-4-dehydrorhamnose reductase [Bacteroidota bacterium]MCH8523887.1 dTDP-4-dehydrorhamnose reductase [Balneolales bacterium]